MKKSILALLLAAAALCASCSKNHKPLMDGTYWGKYTMISTDGEEQVWDVILTLDGDEFFLSDGDENTIPQQGSIDCFGKFYAKRRKIKFECEPQIILSLYIALPSLGGEYNYTFDGRQLHFSDTPGEGELYNGCSFDWSLTRQ